MLNHMCIHQTILEFPTWQTLMIEDKFEYESFCSQGIYNLLRGRQV